LFDFVFAGLGNPLPEFVYTRHNIGHIAIDKLIKHYNIQYTLKKPLFKAGEITLFNKRICFLKTRTFMNESGRSILKFISSYNVSIEKIFIIYDDMDLPCGKIRIRKRGGSGGHRGMKSIIEYVGTNEIPRIRIGIGRPPENINPVDYVLTKFTEEEFNVIEESLKLLPDIVETIVLYGIERAMSKFN